MAHASLPMAPTPAQQPSPSKPDVIDPDSFHRLLGRSNRALAAFLGIPVLILLALVLYLMNSAQQVQHSDQVLTRVIGTQLRLMSMQSSFRGYRLSGDTQFLTGFSEGRDASGIPADLNDLETLVTGHPQKQQAVQALREDTEAWFDFIADELAAVDAEPELMNNAEFLNRGVPLFDRVNDRFDRFIEDEVALRQRRAATLKKTVATVLTGFGLAAFLGIPLLGRTLVRLLRKLNDSYAANLHAAGERAAELQVTLSSIGDAVVATDDKGRIDFINPVAGEMMGWTQEEARGKPLEEVFAIFNDRTGEPAENPVARVLRENKIVGLANHTVLQARDGRRIPIEDSAAPIREGDGRVKGVILVFHDVTEKYHAADQLRQSESRLSFLNMLGEATRLLPDGAAVRDRSVDLLGNFLKVSRCAYATVDPATGDFSVLSEFRDGCASTIGDYQLSRFGPRAQRKMYSGRTLVVHHVDEELPAADGGDAFRAMGIQAIICCPLLKEGRLCAMMAVHQISPRRWTVAEVQLVETVVERAWTLIERKQAETDLRKATERAELAAVAVADAAERFRLLGEVISLQVWTATPDGHLDYVNQECLKYFAVANAEEVLGEGWGKFVHEDDLPAARERWQQALASGDRYSVEFRLRNGQDGKYRWFLVRAEPMRDRQGNIVKWFGTNTAIHELKTAQSDAERANRAKDNFLAALSHELRTPLTPVLMTAVALREDDRLPPDVQAQLGMMERNIALEARLIDDLLDLTSISRGKLQLRAERCDAHSLIGLALEIVRNDAEAKGLELECDFAAARSGLMADPARFQQVIWNLLRNAVKFTPDKGRIRIRTRDAATEGGDSSLQIEISDTGIGIDQENLEEIFQPFEQGVVGGDHRFGGVGLGLAIARAIVSLHGGHIKAFSEGPQRGATFIVEFPGAIEPPAGLTDMNPALPPASPSSQRGSGKCRRLLLVEDHPATLQALSTLLARAGHTVTTATSLAEAYAAAAIASFDLVISDLGLPDGTGAQLMENLRDKYQLTGIALSGYGMEEDLARCREAGFIAHLVKPVRFADLSRVLDALPDHPAPPVRSSSSDSPLPPPDPVA